MVRHQIKDHVVTLAIAGEIFSRVINDRIRAEGLDHLNISRTANSGNLSPKHLSDLYGERTHASGSAIDQHLPARLKPRFVTKSLQCSECGDRHRRHLLERHVTRLARECRLRSTGILGKSAVARSKHLVAHLELRNVSSESFNLARHITPRPRDLSFAKHGHYATNKCVS